MDKPNGLSWTDQVKLLQKRGMIVEEHEEDTLKRVSYYRIKEFAAPLAQIDENGEVNYSGITFSEVVKRYYQDKNLRLNLLHAIEQIEVALKTQLAYILGERYGAYGYLDFYNWTNHKKFTKFTIEKQQFHFKQQLQSIVEKSNTSDIKLKENQNEDGFPTVWLAIDSLMFGNLVTIIKMISKSNLIRLAENFNCTGKELVSWLRCLNFIRNICAHNSNIIDIKLNTVPVIRKKWGKYLYIINGKKGKRPTNRLALVLMIIITMVNAINKKYRWGKISNNIYNIYNICNLDDKKANLLGFANAGDAIDIIKLSKEIDK